MTMEPAYWQMRRLVQSVRPNTPESEYLSLEVSPPPVSHPPVENDPDLRIEPGSGETPLLEPACGRVSLQGGWRILRPSAEA